MTLHSTLQKANHGIVKYRDRQLSILIYMVVFVCDLIQLESDVRFLLVYEPEPSLAPMPSLVEVDLSLLIPNQQANPRDVRTLQSNLDEFYLA